MDDERRGRLRASDGDRQEVVELLRVALDTGRLKMDEYVDRMGQAYEAVTYADLAALHSDLPATAEMELHRPATPPAAAPGPGAGTVAAVAHPPGIVAGMPTALKVLWTVWLSAMSINVLVWVLIGTLGGQFPYPWPLWVAVPGTALVAVSAGVHQIKKGRPVSAPKKPGVD